MKRNEVKALLEYYKDKCLIPHAIIDHTTSMTSMEEKIYLIAGVNLTLRDGTVRLITLQYQQCYTPYMLMSSKNPRAFITCMLENLQTTAIHEFEKLKREGTVTLINTGETIEFVDIRWYDKEKKKHEYKPHQVKERREGTAWSPYGTRTHS